MSFFEIALNVRKNCGIIIYYLRVYSGINAHMKRKPIPETLGCRVSREMQAYVVEHTTYRVGRE